MDWERYLDDINNKYSCKFNEFCRALLEKNKICNLTSICDEKGVKYKHFLDSAVGEFLFPKGAQAVEIGSGGGFPSIPIKIFRDDLQFTLIESTGKKCNFLNEIVDKLDLSGVSVLKIRAEDGARTTSMREKYDVACARAVAQLNTLAEYCMPYVKVGGLFIAYKGDAEDEIKSAEKALKILGGEIEKVIEYELPECGARTLVSVRKVKPTPSKYPRGQGRERKNPL